MTAGVGRLKHKVEIYRFINSDGLDWGIEVKSQ